MPFYAQSIFAEAPMMKVRFQANLVVCDKETGDTIRLVDRDLFALPDTTDMGNLYSCNIPKLIIQIEAPAGAKFLVRVRTHVPNKKWYQSPEGQKEYDRLVKHIEKQGQHETVWLGPFTIPDKANTPEGIVVIEFPDVKLSRVK